jgi:outer membrane protein assembly factor BamB
MNKLLLPLLLAGLLQAPFARSQRQNPVTSIEIGRHYGSGLPVNALQYQFELPVYRFFPSEGERPMTVLLRKMNATATSWKTKGELLVIDPVSGHQKWSKKNNYTTTSIQQSGDVLLEQRGNKLSRLTLADGTVSWKRKTFIFKSISSQNTALCYDVETGFGTLVGVDLNSGMSRWSRLVSGERGWESAQLVNDTTVMIKANGLHAVGVQNGVGWNINRITHTKKTNMGRVGLAILTGAAIGAMGYMAIPTGDFSDYYLNISSNVLYHGDAFYLASRERISCHSLDGKKIWETLLNGKITSQSHLYMAGNTLYMVNKGAALRLGYPAALGNPFVAAFDPYSGEQLFIKEWDERKSFVSDVLVEENELLLLYKDKVDIQRFSPEGLVQKFVSKMPEDTKLNRFVSDLIFVKQDSSFFRPSFDKEHFYIFSEKTELYRFSNDFEAQEKVPMQSIYRSYLETENYHFLGNGQETYVVSKNPYQPVARFDAPLGASVMGEKLYFQKENRIMAVDISAFGAPASLDE